MAKDVTACSEAIRPACDDVIKSADSDVIKPVSNNVIKPPGNDVIKPVVNDTQACNDTITPVCSNDVIKPMAEAHQQPSLVSSSSAQLNTSATSAAASSAPPPATSAHDARRAKHLRAVKSLAIVLLVYLCLVQPYSVTVVISRVCGFNCLNETLSKILSWLPYSHEAINPLLFLCFHHEIRAALLNLCRKFRSI